MEGAAVPILTFDWEGINIDLLFARLNTPSVPSNFDIDNDMVLSGVDSATEKSLNGPRVTNLIAALVGGTDERYQTFLTVVRLLGNGPRVVDYTRIKWDIGEESTSTWPWCSYCSYIPTPAQQVYYENSS